MLIWPHCQPSAAQCAGQLSKRPGLKLCSGILCRPAISQGCCCSALRPLYNACHNLHSKISSVTTTAALTNQAFSYYHLTYMFPHDLKEADHKVVCHQQRPE